MLSAILAVLTSGGFGSIIGLIGSWLTKVEDRKTKAVEHQHELLMADKNLEEKKMEYVHVLQMQDKQITLTEKNYEGMEKVTEAQAFVESQKQSDIKIVEVIKAWMRPIITLYLLLAVTIIGCQLNYVTGGFASYNQESLFDVYKTLISELVFTTSLAVTWWFGSRPSNTMRKR